MTIAKSGNGWRLAKSLITLYDQVDAAYPGRKEGDDGSVGDVAHQSRTSDHNPNSAGVVTAIDITHSPPQFDSYAFAEALRQHKDERVKYVISHGRIFYGPRSPSHGGDLSSQWKWESYSGEDPHDGHIHISVGDSRFYDQSQSWDILAVTGEPAPLPTPTMSRGKGSWYSQYQGKYNWHDPGDKPNWNALGVPDNRQGIAFFNNSTLGKWFNVTAPNGKTLLLPQSDIGPRPATGRLIDISARAAEMFGYSPDDLHRPDAFPTDSIFTWSPAAPPQGTESLTPKQQAIAYDPIQVIGPAPPPGPTPAPSATISMQVSGNVRITINGTTVFVPD